MEKIKCPFCGNEMNVYEASPSLLHMAVWLKIGCEVCGFLGEVKLHPDIADEYFGDEWRKAYNDEEE